MKIYTRTGDRGETGLFSGPRVSKDHARICAYGDVDELNSVLGMVLAEEIPEQMSQLLTSIQHDLFAAGAELATPNPAASGTKYLQNRHVEALERAIDRCEQDLEPLKQFILPGGCRAAATLHFGRAVCRRMERRLVALRKTPGEEVSEELLRYVNRLSDLLFVLARAANVADKRQDVEWRKPNAD